MPSSKNIDSSVYYKDHYWNDYSRVVEYMSENFSGDKTIYWMQHFREKYCHPKPKLALSFNCGNGWVERSIIDNGIAEKIIAFDISRDLLQVAKKEKNDRSIEYFQADVNQIDFAADQFDLIINVAALHHTQFIDRFVRILCKTLKPGGLFVNFDYIGPHRNQYPVSQWNLIRKINQSLPENARRSPLIYSHLPTMLSVDPTEAIHSELIIETVQQYFDLLERRDTGGGIAYEILTHNENLPKLEKKVQDEVLDYVLRMDRELTIEKKVPPMFSYFVGRPQKSILKDSDTLIKLTERENRREKLAEKWFGSYYLSDTLKMVFHRLYVSINRRFPSTTTLIKKIIRKILY